MFSTRYSLLEFKELVYNHVSSSSFNDEFSQLYKNGNRREMIETLLGFPAIKNFLVNENFTTKNDEKAQEFYNQTISNANFNRAELDTKLHLLDKALFASTHGGKLFFLILIERTRFLYKLGQFYNCLDNSNYLRNSSKTFSGDDDFHERIIIESLLTESELFKKLRNQETSKIRLNEAMRRVNDFIQKKFPDENEEILKNHKISLLKSILGQLNESGKFSESILKNTNEETKNIEIPTVELSNVKLKSCSDSVALGYNSKRGRFLFAEKTIKTGSILIIDKPFTFATDSGAFNTNCLHCHISLRINKIKIPCKSCQTVSFCSEICQLESWEKYHKFECKILNHLFNAKEQKSQQRALNFHLAYRMTVTGILSNLSNINLKFLEYHSVDSESEREIKRNNSKMYDCLNYETVYKLETHCTHIDIEENLLTAINSIFLMKLLEYNMRNVEPTIIIDQRQFILLAVGTFHHLQAIKCNAYEIVENVRDEKSKIYEPRIIGGAIYTTVSLSNHSCYPNVVRHNYPGGTVVVRAIRPINKGTEIVDCYGPHFLKDTRDERRDHLQKKYHFFCECEACNSNLKMPLIDKPHERNKKGIIQQLKEIKEIRLSAISRMYNGGDYAKELEILQENCDRIEKILMEPSLEGIKTQQSIIQCLNSIACTSIK